MHTIDDDGADENIYAGRIASTLIQHCQSTRTHLSRKSRAFSLSTPFVPYYTILSVFENKKYQKPYYKQEKTCHNKYFIVQFTDLHVELLTWSVQVKFNFEGHGACIKKWDMLILLARYYIIKTQVNTVYGSQRERVTVR